METGAEPAPESISDQEYQRDYAARFTQRNFLVSIDLYSGQLTELYTGDSAMRILALPGDRIAWVVPGADDRVTHEIVFESAWPFEGGERRAIMVGDAPSPVLTISRDAVPPRGGWYKYKYSLTQNGTTVLDPDVVIGGPGQDLN